MTIEQEKEIVKAIAMQKFLTGSVDLKKIAETEKCFLSDVEMINMENTRTIEAKVQFLKEMEGGA